MKVGSEYFFWGKLLCERKKVLTVMWGHKWKKKGSEEKKKAQRRTWTKTEAESEANIGKKFWRRKKAVVEEKIQKDFLKKKIKK